MSTIPDQGTKDDLAEAKAALQEAHRLAPEAGETFFAQALYEYYADMDFNRALATLEMAARSLPNNAKVYTTRGLLERRLGRWNESLRHLKRAIELDPKKLNTYSIALETAEILRHYAEARRVADAAIAAFPAQADVFRSEEGFLFLDEGDIAAARRQLDMIGSKDSGVVLSFWVSFYERHYREAAQVMEGLPFVEVRDYFLARLAMVPNALENPRDALQDALARNAETFANPPPDYDPALRIVPLLHAALGNKTEAIRTAKRAVELYPVSKDSYSGEGPLHVLALVYASTGEKDRAFQVLSTLVKLPGLPYRALKFSPAWDNLRSDPRFEKILAQASKPL